MMMAQTKIPLIIPARKGSQRIPRKNIKLFCGRPIIEICIEHARGFGLFSEILVSTDCEKTAQIASAAGARALMRPKALSGDSIGTNAVVAHTGIGEKWVEDQLIGLCYPTSVFLRKSWAVDCITRLVTNGDTYFSCIVKQLLAPVHRAFQIDTRSICHPLAISEASSSTRSRERMYIDAAQFYVGTLQSFSQYDSVFTSPATAAVVTDTSASTDIDTMADWHYAEYLYEKQHRSI